jgi:two-component system, sensor histidine kinase and response regulator
MDGLEATVAIRRMEQETGGHTPIVAMTARAMKGDRESCLEAGMDSYLSKPIQPNELLATIDRLMSHVVERGQLPVTDAKSPPSFPDNAQPATLRRQNPPSLSQDQATSIDMAALRARVEDDLDLIAEMMELFQDSAPLLLAEIEAGVDRADSQTIERAAHALKGALQSLAAGPAARAAFRVEELGRAKDLDLIEPALQNLQQEFQRLSAELQAYSQQVRT